MGKEVYSLLLGMVWKTLSPPISAKNRTISPKGITGVQFRCCFTEIERLSNGCTCLMIMTLYPSTAHLFLFFQFKDDRVIALFSTFSAYGSKKVLGLSKLLSLPSCIKEGREVVKCYSVPQCVCWCGVVCWCTLCVGETRIRSPKLNIQVKLEFYLFLSIVSCIPPQEYSTSMFGWCLQPPTGSFDLRCTHTFQSIHDRVHALNYLMYLELWRCTFYFHNHRNHDR